MHTHMLYLLLLRKLWRYAWLQQVLFEPLCCLLIGVSAIFPLHCWSCRHHMFLLWFELLQLKGNAGSKRQHVHGCSLVRARKFYGYHSSEELFVKIHLYPNIILSFLEFSYIHIIVKSMFIEHLDKDIAIIRMTCPVLPNFFWYTSWTFDWCSVVIWNPFVVCMVFLFIYF